MDGVSVSSYWPDPTAQIKQDKKATARTRLIRIKIAITGMLPLERGFCCCGRDSKFGSRQLSASAREKNDGDGAQRHQDSANQRGQNSRRRDADPNQVV